MGREFRAHAVVSIGDRQIDEARIAEVCVGLFDLERELAQLFDRRVDLLCKDSIHRLLEADILSEARVISAA